MSLIATSSTLCFLLAQSLASQGRTRVTSLKPRKDQAFRLTSLHSLFCQWRAILQSVLFGPAYRSRANLKVPLSKTRGCKWKGANWDTKA